MAWSNVAIGFAGFAAGVAVTGAYYERAARAAAELRAEIAEQRPAEQVAADRRLGEVDRQQQADRQQARAAVAAAPQLADVLLPADLASLLAARIEATRRTGSGPVPGGAVSRPGDAGLRRGGADAGPDLR